MKTLHSIRKFRISGFESGIGFYAEYYLNDLLSESNDSELCYSIQDDIDTILSLKIDEYTTMYCNRDNQTIANLIIIWRIQ